MEYFFRTKNDSTTEISLKVKKNITIDIVFPLSLIKKKNQYIRIS